LKIVLLVGISVLSPDWDGIGNVLRKYDEGKQLFFDVIIVSGSGRSGTTWLGNVIAGDEFRILFEPFDYRHVPEANGLGLRPYFRPKDNYPQWFPFIERVMTGNIENKWIDQEKNRLNIEKIQKGILIKEIRGNGMLAWIADNFHCKIVYIIRHPCAVITSRLKLKWETHLESFWEQQELIDDYLLQYKNVIENAKTEVQKHAVMWCIENLIPLHHISEYGWIFCKYEHLLMDPEKEIKRILNLLGQDFSDSRKKAIYELVLPSGDKCINNKIDFLNSWKYFLTKQDQKDIAYILNVFDIALYSIENMMPIN
jgi:hypothetical protein